MSRMFLLITILIISLSTVWAEDISTASQQIQTVKQEKPIKETYKLEGQIEYDDNPVETIYLDENIEKPQVNIPQHSVSIPVSFINITTNANSPRSALARAAVRKNSIGDILPLTASLTESMHGFTYGTIWGEEISFSQLESTTGIFVRYDAPKYFSIASIFKQSASQDIGSQYGTWRISPEWHITDRLTLKDSYTDYVNAPKTKNEITLVYRPALKKYADSLKFELGIAESYYTSGKKSSAISFSTGFKL